MSNCVGVHSSVEHDANMDCGSDKSLFEPSAAETANDSDDERTLDEEEALAAGEHHDPKAELNSLQQEGDMPLEQLLALYGYNNKPGRSPPSVASSVPADVPKKEEPPSALRQLYEEPAASTTEQRCLRSGSRPPSEEEDDCDYSPDEDDWKKTIMVGGDYQAGIPDGLCSYDDVLPYENEDKLLWNPHGIDESVAEAYMQAVRAISGGGDGLDAVPNGRQVRDDEQALYLLQQCDHNIEEALRRRRMSANTPNESMSIWSEEECKNFENGLKAHGKDFHLIRQNKVRTRSVGELVQFYYIWKKTERHDVFANKARLDKKKYGLHPGHPDFMDRFLEEHDMMSIGGGAAAAAGRNSPVCLVYAPAAAPQPDPLALGEREVFATLTTSPNNSQSDQDTDHDTSAVL